MTIRTIEFVSRLLLFSMENSRMGPGWACSHLELGTTGLGSTHSRSATLSQQVGYPCTAGQLPSHSRSATHSQQVNYSLTAGQLPSHSRSATLSLQVSFHLTAMAELSELMTTGPEPSNSIVATLSQQVSYPLTATAEPMSLNGDHWTWTNSQQVSYPLLIHDKGAFLDRKHRWSTCHLLNL